MKVLLTLLVFLLSQAQVFALPVRPETKAPSRYGATKMVVFSDSVSDLCSKESSEFTEKEDHRNDICSIGYQVIEKTPETPALVLGNPVLTPLLDFHVSLLAPRAPPTFLYL